MGATRLLVADHQFILATRDTGYRSVANAVAELIDKYSLERNREISERLEGFKQVDSATQVHGNHIYRGEIGSWREFVDEKMAKRLELLLRPSLARYGYLS